MRRRFFVDRFDSNSAALHGDTAEHLGRVLRAEPGHLCELSDGHHVFLARIERVALSKRGDSRIEFALVEPISASEPLLRIELLISLVKFDRFEWCLEKATELGVAEITPLAATRTDEPLIAAAAKRRARWEKIALESAQQSRCLRPPEIRPLAPPGDAFAHSTAACKILLSERRDAPFLRDALAAFLGGRSFSSGMEARIEGGLSRVVRLRFRESPISGGRWAASESRNRTDGLHRSPEIGPDGLYREAPEAPSRASAALAIGPEGGWTGDEIAAARDAGFVEASLGENILRTETTVIASLAIFRFALGDDGML